MTQILGKRQDNKLPFLSIHITNQVVVDSSNNPPARVERRCVKGLIDTGATHSAVSVDLAQKLALPIVGSRPVLYPNMSATEFAPTYVCDLSFFKSFSDTSAPVPWPDYLEVLAFDLTGRRFQAVIGMDILRHGTLTLEKAGSVAFNF